MIDCVRLLLLSWLAFLPANCFSTHGCKQRQHHVAGVHKFELLFTRWSRRREKILLTKLDDDFSSSSIRSEWQQQFEDNYIEITNDEQNDGDSFIIEEESDIKLGKNEEEIVDPLLEEYRMWSKTLHQAKKKLENKRNSLQAELEKARGVEAMVARAQLLVSNLYQFTNPGVKRVIVQDWENDGVELELTLDSQYDSASTEADALFAQARKLKRGSKIIADLLVETGHAVDVLQKARIDLDSALLSDGSSINEGGLRLVQEYLERTSSATNFQIPSLVRTLSSGSKATSRSATDSKRAKPQLGTPASNVRKLKSPGGCTVWVGRNQRGNEYISFQLAKGNDVWMHARGCPGAHVLLQVRRGDPTPTDDCLQFAANLAAFYSDARNERKAPVTLAEPKHLLKPPGAPLGALKVREESQVLVGWPEEVPMELKEARESSGFSDEYRTTDKAKHRRKTQEAVKQNQETQRARAKSKRKDRIGNNDSD